MDEERKRRIVAGVIVGTVVVGLAVLAKRTPREEWGATLAKLAKDAVSVVKARYGDSEAFRMVESTIDRFSTA